MSLENENFRKAGIAVVVPAYNEGFLIAETLRGIPGYVEKIYVVNDGSTDNTDEIIQTFWDTRITYVRHCVNKGVGAAITTGYKQALADNMDIIAVMAGDNQMDPDQLPKLLIPLIEGTADYTKGNRLSSDAVGHGMSIWRYFGNNILSRLTQIASGNGRISDTQNGYTAISRNALEVIDLDDVYPYYGYCNDILIKLSAFGMRIMDVEIPARYGNEKSKIKYAKFMFKVGPMIFKRYIWRLIYKYTDIDFRPKLFVFFIGKLFMLLMTMISYRKKGVSKTHDLEMQEQE